MNLAKAQQFIGRVGWYTTFVEAIRRSVNSLSLFLEKKLANKNYKEINIYDYKMLIDLNDIGICNELYVRRGREPEHRYILEQILQPNMNVLDLGANIGYYTVMMAKRVAPRGRVFAVEPALKNFALLVNNCYLNQIETRVSFENIGISNRAGYERFYHSAYCNRHSFHYSALPEQGLNQSTYSEVRVTSLIEYLKDKPNIDLIRMDVEGYEVEIFEGMLACLENPHFKPQILFEVHPAAYNAEHSLEKVLSKLFAAGYSTKQVAASHFKEKAASEYSRRGYGAEHIVADFPLVDRAVYQDISDDDVLELSTQTDLIRCLLLHRV